MVFCIVIKNGEKGLAETLLSGFIFWAVAGSLKKVGDEIGSFINWDIIVSLEVEQQGTENLYKLQ